MRAYDRLRPTAIAIMERLDAYGGIPTYVIIDPRKSTVTVFSDPGPASEGTRYRARHDYVFGDEVNAGGYVIDSSPFLPYEGDD